MIKILIDIQGFQPDLDQRLRETLEALEDDAFLNNDLDDDFFAALNAENNELYEEEEEDFDDKEVVDWELEFKKFRRNANRMKKSEEDDKRSRTTDGYSMTSSLMFRNDRLRLLDEQFEEVKVS